MMNLCIPASLPRQDKHPSPEKSNCTYLPIHPCPMTMEPGGFKQDGVVNMTRAMEALSPWLNNPRRTIIQVEVLMIVAAALLLLQLILGSCRRRWHSSFLKYGLQVCNGIMFPLIVYTLGTMQSSPIKNSSYPIWAAFLIMASGGTTAVQQYDFYDNYDKKHVQTAVECLRYLFYVVMFSLLIDPNGPFWKNIWVLKDSRLARTSSLCVTVLVSVILMTKVYESICLVRFGYKKKKKSIFIENKKSRRVRRNGGRRMQGSAEDRQCCESDLDMQPRNITIEQIWNRCGNSDDGKALKDMCLSYALFRQLLDRRYFGEVRVRVDTSLVVAPGFLFKTLLPSEEDFERAFRIIGAELGFFYDFFFTKYFCIFQWMESVSVVPMARGLSSLKIVLIIVVGVFSFRKSLVLETPSPIIEVHISDSDYIITLLVLSIALMVELLQVAFYLASDWVQVSLACRYVKKNGHAANGLIEKLTGILRRVIPSGALRNEIDQHSVIFGREHSVQVSDAVKKAIAKSLIAIATDGNQLRNGGRPSTWKKEMFDRYHWTFKNHSQLEVMLIWHIATEYCDVSDDPRNETTTRGVAVNLSRYCAYLIGSVPELLPYHESDTRYLTEKVMVEREELFGSYAHYEIYDKMKNLQAIEEEEGNPSRRIFRKGVMLGKQLESMLDGVPWEVMQEFWAEKIIHVASSHTTTKQHMQHLENGGEFLTHVWAMFSHLGMVHRLSRDKDEVTQQGANLGSAGPSSQSQVENV